MHINFIENGAGLKGAAIYATTLGQCKWTEDYPNSDISRTLRWSNRFVYRGNYIGTFWHGKEGNDIATDTYKYIYKPERQVCNGEVGLLRGNSNTLFFYKDTASMMLRNFRFEPE